MADKQPPKTKKYFRSTKSGAGMTKAGVARYRAENPGSKLKTAVTGKVKKGSKAAKRRKSSENFLQQIGCQEQTCTAFPQEIPQL